MKARTVFGGKLEGSIIFTAGQRAPSGTYRDMESGRIVVLDLDGNLPGTCDGRVATYVMRRSDTSGRTNEPATSIPVARTLVCERCAEAGMRQPAELMYRRNRSGPEGGVGESQTENLAAANGRRFLCRRHFEILPSAFRSDYVAITVLHSALQRES